MIFYFCKNREKFSDYFKPRKKIIIHSRKTLGSIIGKTGFKTKVKSDKKLAEEGEPRRILELMAEAAREKGSKAALALSNKVDRELGDYKIKLNGLVMNIPLPLQKECAKLGIRKTRSGNYTIL